VVYYSKAYMHVMTMSTLY